MLQLQNISVDYVTPHVVKISLYRERQANSLSLALLEELQTILTEISEESNTRVVILTGAGEKAFCAGADLKERAGMNEEQVRHAVGMIRTTMEMVEQLPQPVIATINGIALGGGTELSLACDFRIASENASLGLTETTLAIIPGAGGTRLFTEINWCW